MVSKKDGAGRKKKSDAVTEVEATEKPDAIFELKKPGKYADEAAVTAGLRAYALDPTGPFEDKLARLRAHLAGLLPTLDAKTEHFQCGECDEIGTEDTSTCPFCGDVGTEAEPEAEKEAKPKGKAKPEPVEAPEAAEEAPKTKGKGKKATPAAEPEVEAEKPKKGKGKKADAVSDGDTASPLASVDAGMLAKVGELDAAIERMKTLSTDLASNMYDLGKEIAKIHEEELWKARGHASFKAWVEAECPVARATAYRLMEATKEFDRETYAKVGMRKLALVAGIEDPNARDAALDAARSGATEREVSRIAEGEEGEEEREKPEREKSDRARPKKEDKIVLLAKTDGEPRSYGFKSAKSGKPVKSHGVDSYAEIPIADGVVQRIALKMDGEKVIGVTVAFVAIVEDAAAE